MFKTLYGSVIPKARNASYAPNVQFIFRQQIQPWHPSSTLVHEAALAVEKLRPDKFWDFSDALMENQKEYFDVNVVSEGRNDTYKRLAKLADGIEGLKEEDVYSVLEVRDQPGEGGSLNVGNEVTDDLKLLIKAARLTGVHVSPTVLFNVRALVPTLSRLEKC